MTCKGHLCLETHDWEDGSCRLTVIDEFTRRCMAVVVERRLNSGPGWGNSIVGDRSSSSNDGPPRIISPFRPQSGCGRGNGLPLMPSEDWLGQGSASRPSISFPKAVTLAENWIQRELQLKSSGRIEILHNNVEIFSTLKEAKVEPSEESWDSVHHGIIPSGSHSSLGPTSTRRPAMKPSCANV